jgi:hypothetical protein
MQKSVEKLHLSVDSEMQLLHTFGPTGYEEAATFHR